MSSGTENDFTSARMPLRALVVLVGGLAAAWLSGGSLGWISPPLQRALIWLVLGTVVLASVAGRRGQSARVHTDQRVLLLGASILALFMTMSSLAVVQIAAVASVLAAIAMARPGMIACAAGPCALGATALAAFRLVVDGTATGWAVAGTVGQAEGVWAAWMTGRSLQIGPSFGGVDFLVMMISLTIGWLLVSPPPHFRRAAWAVVFIVLAQSLYLVALAFTHELKALLPPYVVPIKTDISHLGAWTWANAVHDSLPWRLPVLAAILHAVVAATMFRVTVWPAVAWDAPEDADGDAPGSKRRARRIQEPPALPPDWSNPDKFWPRFGPAGLMLVAAVAVGFVPVKPDLTGRRVVAFVPGASAAVVPDPAELPPDPRHLLLQGLVESLGGEFLTSKDLADADLRGAAVLVVFPPEHITVSGDGGLGISEEVRQRIWNYVKTGGAMIVAGEPETRLGVPENALNDLLQTTAMSFRDDTANSLTQRWEDNLQAAPHAATAASAPGRGHFSFGRAASLRVAWPAGPLVVGRWGWNEVGNDLARPDALPYSPGASLGDLVLAAQQKIDQGQVVVLGDATCLSNDGIPFSYRFVAPLLCDLAAGNPSPLAWWRQCIGLVAAGIGLVLLFWEIEFLRVAAAAVVLAAASFVCSILSNSTADLLPACPKGSARQLLYVDGSHGEAFGRDPYGENGLVRLMRRLTDNGYLPLLAPDLSAARLSKASVLISIAPGKAFSGREIEAVKEFVRQGGFFLGTVGAPEAGPSRALLDEFQIRLDRTPSPPRETAPEAVPITAFVSEFDSPTRPGTKATVQFYAAWPVGGLGGEAWPRGDSGGPPLMYSHRLGQGTATVIGDTCFAMNKNFETPESNADFWHTLLKVGTAPAPVARKPAAPAAPAEGKILDPFNLKTDKETLP